MLSLNNKLPSVSVVGVTPFYYMLLKEDAKEAIEGLINVMPIDETVRFIEVLETLKQTMETLSDENKLNQLPREDLGLLCTDDMYRFFVESMQHQTIHWISDLTKLKMKKMDDFADVDFQVGTAHLSNLLKMPAPDLETYMKREVEKFTLSSANDPNSLDTIEYVDAIGAFIEEIKESIVVIERRIKMFEGAGKGMDPAYLTSRYNSILNAVQLLDHTMLNTEGDYLLNVRKSLDKLHLDVRVTLYPRVKAYEGSVKKLFANKNYNSSKVVALEKKKNIFERNIVTLSSKIESVRLTTATDIFYF